eukprot:TRINITY_DN8523_c0_g1_i1.p1 TRINITY_DN8523_c0_g1~~TRINITY_DN8523_c0_g1_i1.p1  ORF type:complete len:505 (+),score=84.37 TRINITY_DN8523_c0_g1_i1:149-1663(+)
MPPHVRKRTTGFAPLRLSFERRLQTLAVVLQLFILPICVTIFSILCCIPFLWPLIILYLIWMAVLDRAFARGGRPILAIRRSWLYNHVRNYFPHRVIFDDGSSPSPHPARSTDDVLPSSAGDQKTSAKRRKSGAASAEASVNKSVDPPAPTTPWSADRNYLFACHPHGLWGAGVWATFVTAHPDTAVAFRDLSVSVHTLRANFFVPLWRDWLTFLGFGDVSRETLVSLLSSRPPAPFSAATATVVSTLASPTGSEAAATGPATSTWARFGVIVKRSIPSCAQNTALRGAATKAPAKSPEAASGPAVASSADTTATKATKGTKAVSAPQATADGRMMARGVGKAVVLVPGGAAEAIDCATDTLTLAARKGFVKIALETGSPLVPVYTFGETDLYDPLVSHEGRFRRVLLRLQKMVGLGLPLVRGRGVFQYKVGLLPFRVPLTTVIGRPVEPPDLQGRRYTYADVDELHARYVAAVEDMYQRYAPRYQPVVVVGGEVQPVKRLVVQ